MLQRVWNFIGLRWTRDMNLYSDVKHYKPVRGIEKTSIN